MQLRAACAAHADQGQDHQHLRRRRRSRPVTRSFPSPRGKRDGVEHGHVLAIYRAPARRSPTASRTTKPESITPPRRALWPAVRLPRLRSGLLRADHGKLASGHSRRPRPDALTRVPADPDAPLRHWLRLTLIPGVGGETRRLLLKTFGLPDAIFAAGTGAAACRRRLDAWPSDCSAMTASSRCRHRPRMGRPARQPYRHPGRCRLSAGPAGGSRSAGSDLCQGRSGPAQPACLAVVGSRNATKQGEAHGRGFRRDAVRAPD